MSGTELLAASAWKGTVILAAAFATSAALRRQSAAVRHFLWLAAFAGLLLIPPTTWIAERWGAPIPIMNLASPPAHAVGTAPVGVAGRAGKPAAARAQKRSPWSYQTPWLLWLWVAGMAATGLRFAVGALRTNWMVRRSVAFGEEEGCRVLVSEHASIPLAWGIRRPSILLPAQARQWPEGRLEAVVRHERQHIARQDLPAQIAAQAACVVYWFHPLAWLGMREFRKHRERACDDAVLAQGMAAHEYAGYLVDVLRETAARRNGWADAPAMADASDFESRVKALLDSGRSRAALSGRAAALVAAAMLLVVAPLAVVQAQSGRAALVGVVVDPSGARVPGCKVVARNSDGSHEEIATSDAAGEYAFRAIPAGGYTLEFMARGFAVSRIPVKLGEGAASRADVHLEVGSVVEQVRVAGKSAAPVPQARIIAGPPQRIRVGGNVQPAKLIHKTDPVYPEDLKNAGVQGVVVIRAVISKEGAVLNPSVINTVDPGLAKAALDAVSQWTYEPTRLNGEPVEMTTTVTVEFQLSH